MSLRMLNAIETGSPLHIPYHRKSLETVAILRGRLVDEVKDGAYEPQGREYILTQ